MFTIETELQDMASVILRSTCTLKLKKTLIKYSCHGQVLVLFDKDFFPFTRWFSV